MKPNKITKTILFFIALLINPFIENWEKLNQKTKTKIYTVMFFLDAFFFAFIIYLFWLSS